MPLFPTLCNTPGCSQDATYRGRCTGHRRAPWANQSPSSAALNGSGRAAHRNARKAAAARANGCCEDCGRPSTELALHHDTPISAGGEIVQPHGRMLCPACHHAADQAAGARR